jgi:hypothetical protein
MFTKIKIPEGWNSQTKDFAVKLKPDKPPGATQWQDVQGRPVVKTGNNWKLQKQQQTSSKKQVSEKPEQKSGRDAQARQPKTNSGGGIKLSPEETEQYNKFSSLAKEKISEGTKKSFYPKPEQAARDEENRKRKFAPYSALSEDQLSAINAYTSEWDTNMNSLLREGKIKSSAKQRLGDVTTPSEVQVHKAIEDLRSALESLPKAPAGTFHRAVSGSVWEENGAGRNASDFIRGLNSLEEGDMIEDPGFSSFTNGGGPVLDQFLTGDRDSDQNIIFEVHSDQMRDISPISRYAQEKEHMLPPNAKFKVIGKKEGYSRKAGKHTIIQLQQL